jgi:hypothetical protein
MSQDTLRLHAKLYARPAIDAATEAYEALCKVAVRKDGAYYALEFSDIDPDVAEVLAAEFANYALQETIERRH